MQTQPLIQQKIASEWTFELLEYYDQQIQLIAAEYGLKTYPNQMEIVSATQMIEACSNLGMPINYNHWSYGKHFVTLENHYKRGLTGLAYELVINSNPCIAYLMEENTLALQVIIMAHACYGHNSFFKNNYLFKTWTNADTIIDYLAFAKSYIAQCEEQYGATQVEELLDACHALKNHGVDKYIRSYDRDASEHYAQQNLTTNPEENILYFLERNSPQLESWQRDIIRIVRKIAQYFYPQAQTKVMNEGWATFWHYTIINTMYNRKLLDESFMLEFLHLHTEVIKQLPFDHPNFNGLNPYTLGFAIFQDVRRICENPTAEDQVWFPNLVNTNWLTSLDFAMCNFKDESFIAQYLSPKVIRDLKLFTMCNDPTKPNLEVTEIHDEIGYQKIRELLAQQYELAFTEPNIQVYNVDAQDQTLTLGYYQNGDAILDQADLEKVMQHLRRIWGFEVKIESYR